MFEFVLTVILIKILSLISFLMISLIIPIVYFFSLGGRFKINFLFRKQKKLFIKDRKLKKNSIKIYRINCFNFQNF